MFKDSELYRHAERELDMLVEEERKRNLSRTIEEVEHEVNMFNGMTPQEFIKEEVLNIISVINPKLHSLKSITNVLDMVRRLVQLENLLPLTLEDGEFEEVSRKVSKDHTEVIYQNTRNIKVYKSTDRGVYHLDGPYSLNVATGVFEDSTKSAQIDGQMSIFDFIEEK